DCDHFGCKKIHDYLPFIEYHAVHDLLSSNFPRNNQQSKVLYLIFLLTLFWFGPGNRPKINYCSVVNVKIY
ncbi:MAG: hypothetical protein CMQ30_04385, partial [Gammaproteobacteria bacterium]|nr:hypothetical protein [Gammaproteobacteria bacterium]